MTTLGIISFSELVGDARVLKQIDRLGRDYELVTCGYGPAPRGVSRHIEIPSELVYWRYDRAAVIAHAYRRAYWNNEVIKMTAAALEGWPVDAILANDVDSVGLAVSLAPRFGVHADLHEYAPRQKEDLLRWRIFVGPFLAWQVRTFVKRARSVTTVSQGLADEYRREFGLAPRVVTNAAPFADRNPAPVGHPLRLVHSGVGRADRNILALIEAVTRTQADATLDLYLTGHDSDFLATVRTAAQASDGRARLLEPVPYETLGDTLASYDVGLHLLLPTNFNNRMTLPNKLFDYVQARLGVIVGPTPDMVSVVERFGIGAVTDDFSAAALTRLLDGLDDATVADWKAASHAHARELSADSQVEVWADAIAALMHSPAGDRNGA